MRVKSNNFTLVTRPDSLQALYIIQIRQILTQTTTSIIIAHDLSKSFKKKVCKDV